METVTVSRKSIYVDSIILASFVFREVKGKPGLNFRLLFIWGLIMAKEQKL